MDLVVCSSHTLHVFFQSSPCYSCGFSYPVYPRRLSSRSITLCVFIVLHSPSHSCLNRPFPSVLYHLLSLRYLLPSASIDNYPTMSAQLHFIFLATHPISGHNDVTRALAPLLVPTRATVFPFWIKMCSFPCVTPLGRRKFPSPPVSPHLIL